MNANIDFVHVSTAHAVEGIQVSSSSQGSRLPRMSTPQSASENLECCLLNDSVLSIGWFKHRRLKDSKTGAALKQTLLSCLPYFRFYHLWYF